MSLSPDNSTVCTASADETLRFWKIFNGGKDKYRENKTFKEMDL